MKLFNLICIILLLYIINGFLQDILVIMKEYESDLKHETICSNRSNI